MKHVCNDQLMQAFAARCHPPNCSPAEQVFCGKVDIIQGQNTYVRLPFAVHHSIPASNTAIT